MTALEQFVRRYARRITVRGSSAFVTDGDPLLVEAFKQLGWTEPYADPIAGERVAAVESSERAVIDRPSRVEI